MATGSEPPESVSKKKLFETMETAHSRRIESTYLVDLRRHPRFDTRIPGIATSDNGKTADVTVANISRSGLQLEGSQRLIGMLFTNFSREDHHTPTSLQVSFPVPEVSDHSAVVKVRCRTAYTRCRDNDLCQVGMEIVAFDNGGEAFVEYVLYREATD